MRTESRKRGFSNIEISEERDYSDAVAEQIDVEVRRIIDAAHSQAMTILTDHRDQLEQVSQRLLEVETLEAAEFVALLEGKDVVVSSTTPPPGSPKINLPKPNEGTERPRPTLDRPPSPSPA